jgi:hypothetical protein
MFSPLTQSETNLATSGLRCRSKGCGVNVFDVCEFNDCCGGKNWYCEDHLYDHKQEDTDDDETTQPEASPEDGSALLSLDKNKRKRLAIYGIISL